MEVTQLSADFSTAASTCWCTATTSSQPWVPLYSLTWPGNTSSPSFRCSSSSSSSFTPSSLYSLSATIPRWGRQFIKTRRDFIEIKYIQVYCWIILGHGIIYFLLFANFYRKAYRSGKRTPQITEKMDWLKWKQLQKQLKTSYLSILYFIVSKLLIVIIHGLL